MKRTPARVTRLRQLTPGQERRLALLRQMARLLDSATTVPGTSIRIGLDPILGLLWQARDLNLPRVVQLRMIGNVAIDALIGAVPLLGDLFDVAWKANDMNMALLDRHATEERRAAPGDWLFVSAMTVLLLAIAAAPIGLLLWLWQR